jgi:DNA-directed RNA polymerase subunit beta
METGEVMVEANHEITAPIIAKLIEAKISAFDIFFPELDEVGNVISATLRKDAVKRQEDALLEIYRKLRPGDPPTVDTATQLFQGMFFDARKYDFSRVGRMKFNIKLYERLDFAPLDKRTQSNDFRHGFHRPGCAAHRRGGRYRSLLGRRRTRGGHAPRTSSASVWSAWSAP